MNIASQPLGSVDVAIAHATRLLEKNPELAAEQASEILNVDPAHPTARLILGAAQRRAGRAAQALAVLEALARELPNAVPVYLELGVARAEAGHLHEAIAALRRAVKLKPASADGWRLLADHLDVEGDSAGADAARARYIKAATTDPRLMTAAAALVENNLPVADARLRAHLNVYPTDVAALRMLAEVAARLRRYGDAQKLLERCLELAPSFDAARYNYASSCDRQGKPAAALRQMERLLAHEPRNPGYRNLQAAILANLGDYAESIEVYEAVLREYPQQPKIWMSYGHALSTAGRNADGDRRVSARHRRWSRRSGRRTGASRISRPFAFTTADTGRDARCARAHRPRPTTTRLHFEFSLGKALEDRASTRSPSTHYASGQCDCA